MKITTRIDWSKTKRPENYYLAINIYGHKDKLEIIQKAIELLQKDVEVLGK